MVDETSALTTNVVGVVKDWLLIDFFWFWRGKKRRGRLHRLMRKPKDSVQFQVVCSAWTNLDHHSRQPWDHPVWHVESLQFRIRAVNREGPHQIVILPFTVTMMTMQTKLSSHATQLHHLSPTAAATTLQASTVAIPTPKQMQSN